jgi:hypothetical protein
MIWCSWTLTEFGKAQGGWESAERLPGRKFEKARLLSADNDLKVTMDGGLALYVKTVDRRSWNYSMQA